MDNEMGSFRVDVTVGNPRSAGRLHTIAGVLVDTGEVVFGEPGDLVLLGARSLEGLNLTIDPIRKQLVDAGPAPAAAAA